MAAVLTQLLTYGNVYDALLLLLSFVSTRCIQKHQFRILIRLVGVIHDLCRGV